MRKVSHIQTTKNLYARNISVMFVEDSIDFCIRKLILSALKLSSVDSKEKKFNNKLIFFLQKTCTCLVTLGEMKCLGGKYLYGILISLHLQNKYTEGKVLLFFACICHTFELRS